MKKNLWLTLCTVALLASNGASAQEIVISGQDVRSLDSYQGQRMYWRSGPLSCPGGELGPPCRIRYFLTSIEPASYGDRYVDSGPGTAEHVHSRNIAVDFNYLYFLGGAQVFRFGVNNASYAAPEPVASLAANSGGDVAVDSFWVYWTENTATSGTLYRALKNGIGARIQMHHNSAFPLRKLAADGQGGVLFIASTPGIFTVDILHRVTESGPGFAVAQGPGGVQSYATDAQHLYAAQGISTSVRRLYRMPLTDVASFTAGTNISGPNDGSAIPTMLVDDTNVYYFRDIGATSNDFVYRLAKDQWQGGTPSAITTPVPTSNDLVDSESHIYWRGGTNLIYRLEKAGATPVEVDLGISALEVVQSSQRPDNVIRLIADRETTARVYPLLNSTTGAGLVLAAVRLRAFAHGGGELAGSPLPAQTISINPFVPLDRTNLAHTVNFDLPSNWLNGAVTLQAEIASVNIAEPNTANNVFVETGLEFLPKTHVCIKFVPISTTESLTYRVSPLDSITTTPGFLDIVRRLESLYATREVRYYTQSTPLRAPQSFPLLPEPYDLASRSGQNAINLSLWEHNLFDSAPDWCGGDNARTHYVAMVHPGLNTTIEGDDGPITVLGKGTLGEPFQWSKMRSGGTGTSAPDGGSTIAHELGHNTNNLFGTAEEWQHIDCGLPDGADSNDTYPYRDDSIGVDPVTGMIDPFAAWGYDRITRQVVAPDQAADYMSYCDPSWVSDLHWNLVMNATGDRATAAALQPRQAESSNLLAISGVLSNDENVAEILGTTLVTPPLSIVPSASAGAGGQAPVGSYALELLDAGNAVLASYPVLPTGEADPPSAAGDYYFYAAVPWMAATASFRVVRDGSNTLDTVNVSPSAPAVAITSPASNSTIGGTLSLQWAAQDADGDPLRYSVQYRPGAAYQWRQLASGLDGTELTLTDTSELQASDQTGELRVIATDGLRLGVSASLTALTVLNHAPLAAVNYPLNGAAYPVDESVVLQGRGIDPDEGPVAEGSLSWSVTGPVTVAASGKQLRLDDLPPGSYSVALTATDTAGATGTAQSSFVIPPKAVVDSATPNFDGNCRDDEYADDGTPILLRIDDSPPTAVRFIYDGGDLLVCFAGLANVALPSGTSAVLQFDANASGGPQSGSGDFIVEMTGAGDLRTYSWSGTTFSQDASPSGVDGLASSSASGWSAELRINEDRLGGWNHLAAVRVSQFFSGPPASESAWPAQSVYGSPQSYGLLAFGKQGQSISFPALPDVNVGSAPFAAAAAASSGLSVTLAASPEPVCATTSDGFIVPGVAGECTITASQAGNGSFAAATPVVRAFSVLGDSDLDGILDNKDNCIEKANPDQRDSDQDGFGNVCDADIAGNDCIVNFSDLGALKLAFFSSAADPNWNPDADFNGDGSINFSDLAVMRSQFFAAPGPSGVPNVCEACTPLSGTGDPAQWFGVPMFVRGSFNDWQASEPFALQNFGRTYRARFPLAAGNYEYKIADEGWTLEYDEPPVTTVPNAAPQVLEGGPADSSPNVPLSIATPGCYEFGIDIETQSPPSQVALQVIER